MERLPPVVGPIIVRGSGPMPSTHRRTKGEVRRCKKGERSDLRPSEWDKFGYAADKDKDVCSRPIVYDNQTVPITRVKHGDLSAEEFHERFAMKDRPVIIEGAASHWPAMQEWSLDKLARRFKHVSVKVGADDKGKKLKMKFKYFCDYIRHQRDDNPLYLFESDIHDNPHFQHLVNEYEVPEYFPNDWLNMLNRDSRPPHRWLCIGPKRSGTTVHTDPLDTSAWNAVTHGSKRWVLFEPSVHRYIAKGKECRRKGEDDKAIMYFDFVLPRIKEAHPDVTIYEGMQNPGDIIFVPGRWWHGVLNTEDCVAVTQNYCGPDNFERVWCRTRKDREKVAYLWLRNMRKFAPNLYDRAIEMNKRDKFKMRHQRPAGSRLPSASSSSSSSSDSTTDDADDLSPTGLDNVMVAKYLKRAQESAARKGLKRRRLAPSTEKATEDFCKRHRNGGEEQC